MKNIFQEALEKFEYITIFRHENPDMDALGSQLGLCNWINDNYPSKQVFLCGYEYGRHPELIPHDKISDEIIQSSLAIVLDTGNSERIDDDRFSMAKDIMQIDHHPHLEQYASIEIINTKAAATCQILGEIFYEISDKLVSAKTAEYLYKGILTDTLGFKTNNTTPTTLLIASKLADCGLNISKINQELFDTDIKTFNFITYLRTKIVSRKGVAYAIINSTDVAPFDLSLNQVREYVSEFGSVKDYKIWCIFTEDEENKDVYKGSLRSKTVAINEVASRYNGGGHKNACGVKKLTIESIKELLDELTDLL